MNLHNQKAFTLVEMMVVVAIIAVLVALLMPTLIKARIAAQVGVVKTDLSQIELALKRFQNDFGEFPPTAVPGYSLKDQGWGDIPAFNNLNSPAECLWFFLCTKFEAGNNNNADRTAKDLDFTRADLPPRWQILDKVTAGPYIAFKGKQLAESPLARDKGGDLIPPSELPDGIMEIISPFVTRYQVDYGENNFVPHWRPVSKMIPVLWNISDEKFDLERDYLWDAGRYLYVPHWQYNDAALVFDTYKWVPRDDLPPELQCPDANHKWYRGLLMRWPDFPIAQVDGNGTPYNDEGFQLYWLGPDGAVGNAKPSAADPEDQVVGLGDDIFNR